MVSTAPPRPRPPLPLLLPPSPPTELGYVRTVVLMLLCILIVAAIIFEIIRENAGDQTAHPTHDIESGEPTITTPLTAPPRTRRSARRLPLRARLICCGIPFKYRVDKRVGFHCDECVICMEEFEEEGKCRVLKREHTFHRGCIEKWLARATSCPLCRDSVYVLQGDQYPVYPYFDLYNVYG